MKYRLKKDLPFAEIGDEVLVNGYNGNIIVKNGLGESWIGCETSLPKLIMGGWIEEVKPREFWLCKHFAEVPNSDYGKLGNWVVSEEEPLGCNNKCTHIKVREVLNDNKCG